MKRVLCVFLSLCLCLALCLTLTGCMSDEERQSRKEALNVLSGRNSQSYALSTGTTLDNQTLYDDGSIIIQLAGITGTPEAPELRLAVRNGTRSTINLSVDYLIINGWEVDGWLDLYDIGPRTVTMGSIQSSGDLTMCNVTDVVTVELGFEIYDEDYNTISSVSCFMETSSLEQVDPNAVPQGITLLEEDGVTVQAVGLSSGANGTALSLCVQNDTGRTLTLNAVQARCNGEPVELWFYDRVNAGCKRMVTEYIYHEDTYEAFSMEDTDELTFQMDIQDWDTGITLHQADVELTLGDF